MAKIYFSYKNEDRELARDLAGALKEYGHTIRSDEGLHVGSTWRDTLQVELLASDAVVVVWSEHTHRSQYVPAEVGAVRASSRVALLPIIVGDIAVPPFIQDVMAERMRDLSTAEVRQVAERLNDAILFHEEHRRIVEGSWPKVFISHRHKDEQIVRALPGVYRHKVRGAEV